MSGDDDDPALFFRPPGFWTGAERYTVGEKLGKGSFGVVREAVDNKTGLRVAIKRIRKVFDHIESVKHVLGELKLNRAFLGERRVVNMIDVLLPPLKSAIAGGGYAGGYDDVYFVMELMDMSLDVALKSCRLSDMQRLKLSFQIVDAARVLHAAGVVHRDLKPQNIMVNLDCTLRLCDLGMARVLRMGRPSCSSRCSSSGSSFGPEDRFAPAWTDYVTTRWYRAPELLRANLNEQGAQGTPWAHGSGLGVPSEAIDLWSAGCVVAEVFREGSPMFPGTSTAHQLTLVENTRVSLSGGEGVLDMVCGLLKRKPDERASAADTAKHACFGPLRPEPQTPHSGPEALIDLADFDFERRSKLGSAEARRLVSLELAACAEALSAHRTKAVKPSTSVTRSTPRVDEADDVALADKETDLAELGGVVDADHEEPAETTKCCGAFRKSSSRPS